MILCGIDITGVNPSEGSVNGGTLITIYGEYFDYNADSVEVLVGGKLQAYLHSMRRYTNLFAYDISINHKINICRCSL